MYSPVARGVAAAGVAATGIAFSDRDRRDAVAGVANGSIRFVRAFGWGAAVSFDYKYRYVSEKAYTARTFIAAVWALSRSYCVRLRVAQVLRLHEISNT